MSIRLRQINAVLQQRFPESRLTPLTDSEITKLKKRYEDIPAHLVEFFREIGCGSIGVSRYMIYDLINPNEIFDDKTAADLEGIVLIGDDFSGHHEAYDTRSTWRFGSVGSLGKFEPHTAYETFVDFVEAWYVKE